MRVAIVLALALALVPLASSAGELPPDVQDCVPGDPERVAASGDTISVWSFGGPIRR
jgi:hypothetical protein